MRHLAQRASGHVICRKNEHVFLIETADGEDASSIIHLFSKTNQRFLDPQEHRIDNTHSSDLHLFIRSSG